MSNLPVDNLHPYYKFGDPKLYEQHLKESVESWEETIKNLESDPAKTIMLFKENVEYLKEELAFQQGDSGWGK